MGIQNMAAHSYIVQHFAYHGKYHNTQQILLVRTGMLIALHQQEGENGNRAAFHCGQNQRKGHHAHNAFRLIHHRQNLIHIQLIQPQHHILNQSLAHNAGKQKNQAPGS